MASPFDFTKVLLADVDTADDRLKADNSQVNRRTLVRAFFALVEGASHVFRQMAIDGLQITVWCATVNFKDRKPSDKEYAFLKKRYDDAKAAYRELAALDEIALKPDKEGHLREQANRSGMIATVALALRAYSKHQRLGYDCGHRFRRIGWKHFQASVRLRNRLTHPKKHQDLDIRDDELKRLRKAMQWWADTILDMAQAHKRGLRPATNKQLREAKRLSREKRKEASRSRTAQG
jgi:hypothetical protein